MLTNTSIDMLKNNIERHDSESMSAMNLSTVSQHRSSAADNGFITSAMFLGYFL